MPRRIPLLGHALIDRQHRRLERLARELAQAVARNRLVEGALGVLLRATQRHFASEERLMRRCGYPEHAGHRALHDGVVADMQRLRALCAAGQALHRKHVLQIDEWLAHHVSEADRNLVAFLGRQPKA